MNPIDLNRFTLAGMEVTVEEATEALTYTFVSRDRVSRPSMPIALLIPFILLPLTLLGLIGYSYSENPNRPEWELALTGVFSVQVVLWLLIGTFECFQLFRWWYSSSGITIRFTRTHLEHGSNRVCGLEEITGLKLFTYPSLDQPGKREACLSFIIGESGGTHGLFGAFAEDQLQAIADHLQLHLARFRLDQGILTPLKPIETFETTADLAGDLMHTRPAVHALPRFANTIFGLLQNRIFGTAWCLMIFLGLFASGRLILSEMPFPFLIGHILTGFLHLAVLVAIWNISSEQSASQVEQ